jgi:hypothetical protein
VVHLVANAPGSATVTVSVDDGRGGTGSITFNVSVQQPNQPPAIQPIQDQTLAVGEQRDVPYAASDPDGDPLQNPVAVSSDGGIVGASSPSLGVVHLVANAPGSATITVSVDDGRGGTGSITFNVSVEQPAPPPTEPPPQIGRVDLNEIPNISPIEGDVLNTVRSIYANGKAMSPPADPGVFSVVGDTPPNMFLGDFGDGSGDFGNLNDAADLSNLVFYYTSTQLPVGGNSFQNGGVLASNPGWRAADLLNPALADQGRCPGQTPLGCELSVDRPSIVFIIVGRNDVFAGTPLDQFQNALASIVQQTSQSGAIPILTTIPGSLQDVPALEDYDSAIVAVADQFHVPLLNVWRRVNQSAPGGVDANLQLTTSGAGDQLTQDQLGTYGVPNRNLSALRVLRQLQINVPIP